MNSIFRQAITLLSRSGMIGDGINDAVGSLLSVKHITCCNFAEQVR